MLSLITTSTEGVTVAVACGGIAKIETEPEPTALETEQGSSIDHSVTLPMAQVFTVVVRISLVIAEVVVNW